MAYTLNTSHPLYGNLIELIGVQAGALVSHKTARTFTKDSAASYGTGAYGEHFVSVKGGNYSPQGASFTPALSTDGTAHGLTIFYVVNNIDAASIQGGMLSGNNAGAYRIPSVGVDAAGKAQITAGMDSYSTSGTTTVLNTGAFSLCTTRQAGAQTSTSATLYVNGSLEATGGTGINEVSTGNTIDYIGGTPGQNAAGAKYVWIAYFDKALSGAEIADLHTSIAASNVFGLIASSGGTNATAPGGTGTSTGSGSGGTATGGPTGTGTFTSDAMENNTGAGLLASTTVNWTWYQGTIGAAPTSTTHGTGTTSAGGILSLTGLPVGAGFLLARTADATGVYYQPGTVA